MTTIKVDNGTITKRAEIGADPKRSGLLIGRFFDADNKLLDTYYGKVNQSYLRGLLAAAGAAQ